MSMAASATWLPVKPPFWVNDKHPTRFDRRGVHTIWERNRNQERLLCCGAGIHNFDPRGVDGRHRSGIRCELPPCAD